MLLFCAINVSGHAIIKMADLKKMFESARLEKAAEYKIHVFVRTMREVQSIAAKPPFAAQKDETVFVAFLNKKPDKKSQQALLAFKSEADDFAFKGRELYNLRRDRVKSVFASNFVEKILKMPSTTRKITTITKIVEKYK